MGQSVILLIYLVMMAGYNLVITGITVVIILGVFWLSQKFEEKEAYFTGKQQALYGKINAYLYNWLQNFPVICQMHNDVIYFCRRLKRLHERGEKEVLHKLSRFSALNDAMLNFMTNTLPLLRLPWAFIYQNWADDNWRNDCNYAGFTEIKRANHSPCSLDFGQKECQAGI